MKNIDNYRKNIPNELMEKDQWLVFKNTFYFRSLKANFKFYGN
ncbi:MAG: hypothetical protein ACOXZ0_00085 [Eubacteriales bacterium]|jgi:hypothetical protein